MVLGIRFVATACTRHKGLGCRASASLGPLNLRIGSIVVPCCGLFLGSYKVIPKRNYYGDGYRSETMDYRVSQSRVPKLLPLA